jgi:hypothetical protein
MFDQGCFVYSSYVVTLENIEILKQEYLSKYRAIIFELESSLHAE